MKKITTFAILIIIFLFISTGVEARLLPRFLGRSSGSVASGLVVSPRLRSDRLALIVTLSNLNKVNSAFYSLIYQSNGIEQGVNGSLDSSQGNSVTRELLFGTCSSGVCRYQENLSNMTFEVTSELPSGKRVLRRFRVRI